MVTTSRPEGGFYIGATCPGCGGDLELQEDFFVLECSHCGSILRVITPDSPPAYVIRAKKDRREIRFKVDRYLKEQGQPLTRSDFSLERIYYPYWKVDGLQLHIRENITQPSAAAANILGMQIDGIDMADMGRAFGKCMTETGKYGETHDREITVKLAPYHCNRIAGPVVDGIPYSLGMRTGYLKMSPYAREDIDERFEYIPVTKPWAELLAQLNGRKPRDGSAYTDPNYLNPVNLFQTKGCVVYFPFCICKSGGRRMVADGLTGRVIHDSEYRPDEEAPVWPDSQLEFGQLAVDFHRCPTCGVDLPLTESHVYICHNCHSVVSADTHNPLTDGVQAGGLSENRSDPMFPFWVLKLHPETVSKIAKSTVSGSPLNQLIIPAFSIANFKVLRRLVQRLTSAFPQFTGQPVESFDKRFRPVDICLSEAVTLAEICLYCEKAARDPDLSPDSVKIDPRDVGLYYAPFHAESYFYVDSMINAVTFAKNTVMTP